MFPWAKEEPQNVPHDVGDIIVRLEHPDYTGDDSITLQFIERHTEVRQLINEHSHTERLSYDRRQRTHYYGQGH